MSLFTDEFIEQVRDNNDIVELVAERVRLERRGQNWLGLCPFHSEKTPSFSVSPARQMYYCFGCHASGNAFKFLMEMDRLSFPEAVRALATRANMTIPERRKDSPQAAARRKERELLFRVNEWATEYFFGQLQSGPEAGPAREYLRRRGFSDALIKELRIGYASASWNRMVDSASEQGVPLDALLKLGLVAKRPQSEGYYDRFRARVIIPITDARGRVVAFGGRVLDDTLPKYLNSPESELFNKGQLLFGLHYANSHIRKAGQAVLVEGYMDCMAAWQHGIGQVVASLGTALTPDQARLLKRYTGHVVLCYDADGSGLKAALRGVDILRAGGLEVKVATLPEGQDPDDYLRAYGPQRFREEVLAAAQPIVDFQLAMLRRNYDLGSVDGKARFVDAAVALLANLDNEVAKNAYAQQIAFQLQVPVSAVLSELRKQQTAPVMIVDKAPMSRDTTSNAPQTAPVEPDLSLRGYRAAADRILQHVIHDQVDARDTLTAWQKIGIYTDPADRDLVSLLLEMSQDARPLLSTLKERITSPDLLERVENIVDLEIIEADNAPLVVTECLGKLQSLALQEAVSSLKEQLQKEKDGVKRIEILRVLQQTIETQKGLRN